MADLELRLRALAGDAFPPAPDVGAAVAARIGEAPHARRAPVRARRRVLALALALVLVPAAAVAAVPAARDAVLDWLGLASVRVERVPRLPDLPGLDREDLGERIATLPEASRRAGFAIAAPRGLGAPDGVYLTPDGIVSLAYKPRPGLPRDAQTGLGLLVTQLPARQRPEFLLKTAGPGTTVEPLSVDGLPGAFVSGEPHAIVIERSPGQIEQLPPRLAGNTLVFERGGIVLRLEARFGRTRAVTLARSLR
jgi:hypothetical protein